MSLLTPSLAAAELGISIDQLSALANSGAIPFVDIGRGEKRKARRYDPADLQAFIASRKQISCPSTVAPAKPNTPTISGWGVVDFQAERAKLKSARQKSSSARSATKRGG